MSRAAVSIDRVEQNFEDGSVTIYEKQDRSFSGKSRTYSLLEFMALLASHIPSTYEALVYYFGIYSSSHRGKEKRDHVDGSNLKVEAVKGKKGTVNGKVTLTWARLIHRILEVSPLICKKCGGEMKIIAMITKSEVIKKILKHFGLWNMRSHSPPPLPNIHTEPIGDMDKYFQDNIPSDGLPRRC